MTRSSKHARGGKRPGSGRHPGPNGARTVRISVVLSPSEAAQLRAASAKFRITVSGLIRIALSARAMELDMGIDPPTRTGFAGALEMLEARSRCPKINLTPPPQHGSK